MATTERIQEALRKRFRFTEGRVPHDPMDMVYGAGKPPEALLYSLLFMPELSLVADSVLLTNGSSDIEERFLQAKARSSMPLDRLEASFNMIEVPFLFIDQNVSDDEERLLAEQIAEGWRRALAAFCPDRHMVVNVVPPEENASNITVEFFEAR
jgi:hypothetical protein